MIDSSVKQNKINELSIKLNREQAELILTALNDLPDKTKSEKKVILERIQKDVELIKTIWERKIKAEELLKKVKPKVKGS